MAITSISKYNYKEICNELGIEYSDFLALVNNKESISNHHNTIRCTALFVIDKFIESIKKQKIIRVKSKNTTKYYLSFLLRLKVFISEKHPNLLFSEMNEKFLYDFFLQSTKSDTIISQSSINTYTAIVKKLCSFAFENDFLDKNISSKFNKIKVKYLPRYFTNNQIKKIFKEVETRRCPLVWKTIFITLLGTGLRIEELINLRIKDFDVNEKLIRTIGKGQKERYIPIYPEVMTTVLHYLNQTGVEDLEIAKDSIVFSRQYGHFRANPISIRSIQYNLHEIIKKLGYDSRFTVHSFRHTFAVNCLKSGMPLMYLCQVLGHESPSTTAIYLKLLPHDLQSEVSEKFPFPLEKLFNQIISGEDSNEDS